MQKWMDKFTERYIKKSGFFVTGKEKGRMIMHVYYKDKPDRHISCYSYPNCNEAPMGCTLRMGSSAEQYGHRY